MKQIIIRYINYLLIVIGTLLTLINLYGLSMDVRPSGLFEADLRFSDDISLSYEQAIQAIKRGDHEDDYEYAKRLSKVVAKSIAHIHWDKENDVGRFNQLVPIWENYFLYFMGMFSGIPEYKRYHFVDYERSLKRGIGICGDASIVMSQILFKEGIHNQIVSFPKHVVVAVQHQDGTEIIYDPDFGVTIPHSITQLQNSAVAVKPYYREEGYEDNDLDIFQDEFLNDYKRWDDVRHFITKKYYFEKVAYILKWPLPIMMVLLAVILQRKIGWKVSSVRT